jgi:hypothetical protein
VLDQDEIFLDKMISDTIIENVLDVDHNELMHIRRTADIYEWFNRVLVPGLFSNMGPCLNPISQARSPRRPAPAPPVPVPDRHCPLGACGAGAAVSLVPLDAGERLGGSRRYGRRQGLQRPGLA